MKARREQSQRVGSVPGLALVAALAVAASCFAAPLPEPLALTVLPSGTTNVVFRLKNNTTNTLRLPSAGYVLSDFYAPVNTNPAYAIINRPQVDVGLWLTRDWRHVGTNWMWGSAGDWRTRLKIRELKPGATLDVTRSLGPWADLLRTDTNAVAYFSFQIPKEWAEEFGLWQGSLSVTGLTGKITQ